MKTNQKNSMFLFLALCAIVASVFSGCAAFKGAIDNPAGVKYAARIASGSPVDKSYIDEFWDHAEWVLSEVEKTKDIHKRADLLGEFSDREMTLRTKTKAALERVATALKALLEEADAAEVAKKEGEKAPPAAKDEKVPAVPAAKAEEIAPKSGA